MKTLFMIAIAATTYNLLSAQSTFRKSTNGPGFDQGYAVIQTNDKGLCVTGSASSFGSGNDDLYVIKLDSNFTQQWAKSFDWGRHEIGLSVIETRKGNMVVTGYTYKDIISDEQWDMFVMKIDRYGNVLWSKTIGGVKRENGNCITEISSGDLLIAGSTNSYGKGLNDIYLVRLSTNGDLVWAKTLGTTTDDIAYSISKTWNDDVIIAGASNGFRPFLAKCDADGNVLWAKTIAGDAASIGVYNSVVCTKDGGYAATGYTKTAANGYDVLTTKVNALGNVVWSTTIGNNGDDKGNYIIEEKAHLIIAGYANYGLLGVAENLYMIKLSSKGKLIWNKTITEQADAVGRAVTKWKNNSNYIVTGSSWRNKDGYFYKPDVYISDFDTSGAICGTAGNGYTLSAITPYTEDILFEAGNGGTIADNNITAFYGGLFTDNCSSSIIAAVTGSSINAVAAKQFSAKVFPNPAVNGIVNLQIENDATQFVNVFISDIQGNIVFKQSIQLSAGAQTKTLNIAALSKGIYTLHVNAGSNTKAIKFVKAN